MNDLSVASFKTLLICICHYFGYLPVPSHLTGTIKNLNQRWEKTSGKLKLYSLHLKISSAKIKTWMDG